MQKHPLRQRKEANEGADDALIARYIEPHPAKEGIAYFRLKEEYGGYPAWAIIGDLAPGILSEEDIMREFRISREALDATLAFYAHHREEIDAWLTVNRMG